MNIAHVVDVVEGPQDSQQDVSDGQLTQTVLEVDVEEISCRTFEEHRVSFPVKIIIQNQYCCMIRVMKTGKTAPYNLLYCI